MYGERARYGLWIKIGDFLLFFVVAIVFVVSFCGNTCARIRVHGFGFLKD